MKEVFDWYAFNHHGVSGHSGQKGKQASEFLFCFQTVDYKNSGGVVVTMIPYNSTRVKMLPLKEKIALSVVTKQIQYFYFKIWHHRPF